MNESEQVPVAQLQGGWQPAEPINMSLTVVYLCIFLVGVVGNLCNCLVIADTHNRYMKTATNYYLFSLSVSDLLLLVFGLPHDLVNLWHPTPYMFGEFVCLTRGWISEASTYASVLVIVAFTVERYLAICHPLRAHTLSRLSRSVKIIVLIWLVASSCALLVVREYGLVVEAQANDEPSAALCTTVSRNATIFELSVLTFFIIPMAVITILYVKLGCHLRHKTRAIKWQRKQNHQDHTATQQTYYTCTSSANSPTSQPPPQAAEILPGTESNLCVALPTVWLSCLACCEHTAKELPSPPSLVVEGPSEHLDTAVDQHGQAAVKEEHNLLQNPTLVGSPTSLSLGLRAKPAARSHSKSKRRAASCGRLKLEQVTPNLNNNKPSQAKQKPSVSSTSTLASSSSDSITQSLDGTQMGQPKKEVKPNSNLSVRPANQQQQKQPFALQSTVNTANMQSVIKMLVSVVVMFFICWAPFHAQRLMAIYVDQPTKEQELIYSCLNHISGISYYISALVNPILYSLFSLKFRQAFRDTFGRLCRGRRRRRPR